MKKTISVLCSVLVIISIVVPAFFAVSAASENINVQPDIHFMNVDNPYMPIIVDDEESEKIRRGNRESDIIGRIDAPLTKTVELPSSYDSRNYGYITSVKSQSPTGTCWAHAAVSAFETYDIINAGAPISTDYSEAQIVWFAYNTVSSDGTANDGYNRDVAAYSTGGSYYSVAAALANGSGLSYEDSQWEGLSRNSRYNAGVYYCPVFYDEDRHLCSSNRRILDISEIISDKAGSFANNPAAIYTIKQAIMEQGSVCCSLYYNSTNLCTTNSAYGYYCSDNNKSVNHSVTLVGWDDNFSGFKTMPTDANGNELTGAWLVKDSQGKTSKLKGYFWLSYYDKTTFMFHTCKTKDASKTLNIYSLSSATPYNFLSSSTSGNTASAYEKMSAANVYTSKGNEIISSVGYFTLENEYMQISIYKNVTDNFDFNNAVPAYQSDVYYEDYEGYHTHLIPDTQKVGISPGEKYAVVVSYSSPYDRCTVRVPFEVAPVNDDGTINTESPNQICVHPGESFYCFDNWYRGNYDYSGIWTDVTTSSTIGNAYIYVETECGHNYIPEVVAPTCTESGYTDMVCSQCGDKYVTNEVASPGHNNVTETVESTCTVPGYTKTYCSVCGSFYEEEIPASGHNYSSEIVEPTCVDSGYTVYICTRCGNSYSSDETEPLGHNFEVFKTGSASCNEDGNIIYKCSRCDVLSEETIVTTGHSLKTTVVAPTCEEDGYTLVECEKCNLSYKKNVVPASGHNYVLSETHEPDCETAGYYHYCCSNCDSTKDVPIEPAGHSFTESIVPATCTEKGYTLHTCSACGKSYKDSFTDMTEHSFYTKSTKESSCSENGYTVQCCSVCGYEETVNDISTSGHNFEVVKTVPPTCASKGYTVYKCSSCGITYNGDETDMLPHSYSSEVTSPTCTSGGYTTHTCSVCGDSYTDAKTEPAGHSYSSSVTAPTCTAEGYTDFTCQKCGHSYTGAKVPATGHQYKTTVVAPTCTTGGYTTYKCASCGHSYKGSETAALGHDFANYVYNNDATVSSDGTKTAKCFRCSAVDTVPASGTKIAMSNMSISVKDGSVSYKSIVTLTAKASGVPSGYFAAIYDGDKLLTKGSNEYVEYELGQMTSTHTYTIRIIDSSETVQKDKSGNPLEKTSTINVDTGLFSKITAFFQSLFNALPRVTV